jgi:TolB-like protein/Flp pilus assembly protein TadD
MSFIDELKRRNVFKVGIAYIVVAWLMLQVADIILNNIEAPGWVFNTILLVISMGFPLICLFAWAFEMTPEGLKREHEVDRTQSITMQTGRTLDFVIIGVMALALAYFAYDKFLLSSERDPALVEATTQAIEAQTIAESVEPIDQENSIAVLAFVNMSSDPEQEYFADGISEELLNALAKVSALKVAGRTSSFAFKGKNDDLLAIGKVLRVNYILEGSVRKSGNRVRITAQLIKVDDGFHVWSETYDRELTDIFTIQDEISAAILAQLKTQLLGDQQKSAQTDTRAYELYLLAKQRINERNESILEMAVKQLGEATSIDPGYAPVYAQLGIATMLLSKENYGSLPNAESGETARRYLQKALQLAPQNAEALAGMGLYHRQYELDYQASDKKLRRALEINPNMIEANTWLANNLAENGEFREALQLREESFRRDPLHRPTFANLQQTYSVMGQFEKALEMIENLRPYMPGDVSIPFNLGVVYLMNGQMADALEQLRQSYEMEPLNATGRFWYSLALENTRQYKLITEIAPGFRATLALSRLKRPEEAVILGHQAINKGQNPVAYFQALVENGSFAKFIEELESRWPTLDDFSSDWHGTGYGYDAMGHIAYAYYELDQQEKFDDAMARFKIALDKQMAAGADNWVLNRSRAYHAMLSKDYDAAITLLEKAFQHGFYLDTVAETAWPVFKPLDGDPRYQAARSTMLERWNAEMAKLAIERSL